MTTRMDLNATFTFTCEDYAFTDWQVEEIADERLEVETMFTSGLGIAISVASALISTCASFLVIHVILQTDKGLKRSVYHRILFGMSISDIFQSLAIAFVTLPMPTDMFYQQFQGLVIGNRATCQIQGFSVAMGAMTGLAYNAMLSIYYMCSICFDKLDEDFSKCLEPWLHAISISVGFSIAFALLLGDSYHPTPTQSNWCGSNTYPWYCNGFVAEKDTIQIRYFIIVYSAVVSVILFVLFAICMILIVKKVHKKQKVELNVNSTTTSRGLHENLDGSTSVQVRMQERLLRNKKLVSRQAVAYTTINLFNYAMVIVVPIVRNVLGNPILPAYWQTAFLILRPLQGLFNCIIFIYHKVESLKRTNRTLGALPALIRVLKGEEGPDRVMSDLMLVRQHSALARLNVVGDFEEDDEEDDEDDSLLIDEVSGRLAHTSPNKKPEKLEELIDDDDDVEIKAGKSNEERADRGLILSTPEPSATGDDGVSQDLSGFQSSTAYSDSLSFSVGPRSNC